MKLLYLFWLRTVKNHSDSLSCFFSYKRFIRNKVLILSILVMSQKSIILLLYCYKTCWNTVNCWISFTSLWNFLCFRSFRVIFHLYCKPFYTWFFIGLYTIFLNIKFRRIIFLRYVCFKVTTQEGLYTFWLWCLICVWKGNHKSTNLWRVV